jgi:predicted RNA-binding protein with PIN domain
LKDPVRWLVDGMNVIGTRPDGWWRDRDGAMLRLVDLLERWAAAEGDDVVVVFERKPSPPIRSTVIEVAHAPRPRRDAADDEIIRRLAVESRPALVRVVTSDRWLADRARAGGATVEGAESFRARLDDV